MSEPTPPPPPASTPSDPGGASAPPSAPAVSPSAQSGPPTAPPGPGGYYLQPKGHVPPDITGVYYSLGLTILLMIVTLGIWGFFWTYRTNEDLKKYNGDGLGGVLGVLIYLVFSPLLMFTIPNEIKNMYEREGRKSPVTWLWGWWFLLPLIGHIIWYVKVQPALNDFWRSKGARSS